MKLFLLLLSLNLSHFLFAQTDNNNNKQNQIYIWKLGIDSIPDKIFLKEKYLQINSDSLNIISFDVYFNSCPIKVHLGGPYTYFTVVGNSLSGIFNELFTKRTLPVCIYFDKIRLINKNNEVSISQTTLSIKVY